MVLEKKQLQEVIKTLSSDHEIIGPVEEEGGVYYRRVDSPEEIVWDFSNGINNIKDFFFPPRQELYELRRDGIKNFEPDPDRKRIILFPRACDTRALTIMDRLFMGEYKDDSYTLMRKNTLIVGLGCLEPDRHCFCLSIGGGPFNNEGMDVSLLPLGDSRFSVDLLTDKAKELFQASGPEETPEEENRLEELKKKAEAAIARKINVPESLNDSFDSDYWQEVSRACIKCGICSYLCPTCHCFDIVDEGYLRIRCWDTCSSDTFTRMAAGEDHRKQKHTRYRQRVFHKFAYYRDNLDAVACVGCGRCTAHCPVKIDIVEIVNNI